MRGQPLQAYSISSSVAVLDSCQIITVCLSTSERWQGHTATKKKQEKKKRALDTELKLQPDTEDKKTILNKNQKFSGSLKGG